METQTVGTTTFHGGSPRKRKHEDYALWDMSSNMFSRESNDLATASTEDPENVPSATLDRPIQDESGHTPATRSWHDRPHAMGYAEISTPQASRFPEIEDSKDRKQQAKRKRKTNTKPRKFWSKDETEALLKGVERFGIGNWKKILKQGQSQFNNRNPVDLKDRFRTCCPKAYTHHVQGKNPESARLQDGSTPPNFRNEAEQRKSKASQKEPEEPRQRAQPKGLPTEELEDFGLSGFFPRSIRRERRNFTEAEDERLLQGFFRYGPLWSKIQNDPNIDLAHRKATDIRDRFRTRFPDQYVRAGFRPRKRDERSESTSIGHAPDNSENEARHSDIDAPSHGHQGSEPTGSKQQTIAHILDDTMSDEHNHDHDHRGLFLPSTTEILQSDSSLFGCEDITLPSLASLNQSGEWDVDLHPIFFDSASSPRMHHDHPPRPSAPPASETTNATSSIDSHDAHDISLVATPPPITHEGQSYLMNSSSSFLPPPGDLFTQTLPTLSLPLDYDPTPGLGPMRLPDEFDGHHFTAGSDGNDDILPPAFFNSEHQGASGSNLSSVSQLFPSLNLATLQQQPSTTQGGGGGGGGPLNSAFSGLGLMNHAPLSTMSGDDTIAAPALAYGWDEISTDFTGV